METAFRKAHGHAIVWDIVYSLVACWRSGGIEVWDVRIGIAHYIKTKIFLVKPDYILEAWFCYSLSKILHYLLKCQRWFYW